MTTSHNILLVEDEPTLQRILGSVLSDSGHTVESVGTAEQAIELLERPGPQVIDLVLSDKNLPAMNGLDLLEKLRAQDQREHTNRGFILVTGYPSRESAARVLELGGDGYLVKPFRSLLEAAQEVQRVLESPLPSLRTSAEVAREVVEGLLGNTDKSPPAIQACVHTFDAGMKGRVEERLKQLGVPLVENPEDAPPRTVFLSSNVERLKLLRKNDPHAPLVLLDGAPAFATIVELIRLGGSTTHDPSQTVTA